MDDKDDHEEAYLTIADLPALNATLNATAAVLLLAGWWNIKRRRIAVHRRFMIAAFVASSLFLISYVTYHAQIGSKHFPGTGLARVVYFSILIPHVTLAAVVLPLAIVTLRRGLIRDDRRHRRIARVTFPLWLFVSVTGVLVYLMLYQMN
jgi:putative membrane protein